MTTKQLDFIGITLPIKKAALFLSIAVCFAGCKKNESGSSAEPVASTSAKSESASVSMADFTIAVIPDTQYYVSSQFGGTPAMFTSQIDWIKANQKAENIVYVASVGDITDHGDTYASEWTNASTNGYYKLESQADFANGIPYGTCVGNHDQSPNTGHPLTCSTASYNGKFGANRFRQRSYYGGNKAGTGSNSNDCHYDLFTFGGVDFIVIYTEYDSHGDDGDNMNTWVYNLLGTYANRKAIIVSHMMNNASGAWGTTGSSYEQGHVLYNRIASRTNVFMMLGGHFTGESVREDTYSGNTIRTYLSDYQGWAEGGGGYMRLMKFSVTNNTVSVRTYSPFHNVWQTDANSQFTKPLFTTALPSNEGVNTFEQYTVNTVPAGYEVANGGVWVSSGVTPLPTGYASTKALFMTDANTSSNTEVRRIGYVAAATKTFEFKLRIKSFASGGSGSTQFILRSGNTPVFHMAVFPNGSINYYTSAGWAALPGTPVALDTWKSMKVVANAPGNAAAVYVDGVLIGNVPREYTGATTINGYSFGSGGSLMTGDQALFDDINLY